MPISLKCACGRALTVKDEFAGKMGRCPACQKVIAIPNPDEKVEDQAYHLLSEADEAPSRPARAEREPPPRRDPAPPPAYRGDDDRPRRRSERRPEERRGGGIVISSGVIGGGVTMLVAVLWFCAGLAFDRIFIYPPILFVLGLIGFLKSLAGHEED